MCVCVLTILTPYQFCCCEWIAIDDGRPTGDRGGPAGPTKNIMASVSEPPPSFAPVPTASDRLWFNVCRTCVGVVVLGLTLTNSILCAAPLVAEGMWPGPPASPPTPAQPFSLFTDEDAQASKMILLISGVQALLLALAAAACMWLRRGKAADAKAAQLLRRRERDAKEERRKKKAAAKKRLASASKDVSVQAEDNPLQLVGDLASPAADAQDDVCRVRESVEARSSPAADTAMAQRHVAERDAACGAEQPS